MEKLTEREIIDKILGVDSKVREIAIMADRNRVELYRGTITGLNIPDEVLELSMPGWQLLAKEHKAKVSIYYDV